jgi:hypothetical protein
MAAGIGGFLILGAGITLVLALLRFSDGSLLLSSAVRRRPQIKLLGGGEDETDQITLQPEEDVAAERWLPYETGGNGIVDLEGIPPPQHRHRPPPIQQSFVLPPPWNKRDQHPLRPSGSAGEAPGEAHRTMVETVPGAGGGGEGGGWPPDLPKVHANHYMHRSSRGNRHFDVPQIGE